MDRRGGEASVERAAGGETAHRLVLVGWAAKGLVYLCLAWLVLQLARGSASNEVSTTGALELLEDTSGSSVVLVVLGIGLLLYAAGRILDCSPTRSSAGSRRATGGWAPQPAAPPEGRLTDSSSGSDLLGARPPVTGRAGARAHAA